MTYLGSGLRESYVRRSSRRKAVEIGLRDRADRGDFESQEPSQPSRSVEKAA
jgi:hypothetical protein